MKILFTANRFPYPPHRGDKLKIFHLARQLSQSHELHLVTFLQDKKDLRYLPELQKIFTKIYLIPLPKIQSYLNCLAGLFQKKPLQVNYFRSGAMARKIRELYHTGNFDAVHVQHLRMAQYWEGYKDVPRVLDLPDAYSLYWKRRVRAKSGLLKMAAAIEQKRVFGYEDILKKYDLSLVCSREDQAWLQAEKNVANVRILPNGVDLTIFSGERHDYALRDKILFTGNMDYAPNVDAVVYFAEEIFPLIQKKIKGIQFIIGGQRPVKKVRALAGKHVVVTGFVEDLAQYYKAAAVVVAPLRFGAGTQNKVLEAMAMGVPVVSREIGFNGLNIQSGEGVILATETASFAEACIALLSSAELREKTGEKGKRIIQSRFDWKVIARQLESYFEEIAQPG